MQLSIQPLSRAFAIELCSWRYEPPYDLYNVEYPPAAEDLLYLLDPTLAYHGILDVQGELVGFCSFGADGQVPGGDYTLEALDIGMGVRPDLTGRGLGARFATAVVDFAIRAYAPAALRVTIAHFNVRAQRVWLQMGFVQAAQFASLHNGAPFIIFERAL